MVTSEQAQSIQNYFDEDINSIQTKFKMVFGKSVLLKSTVCFLLVSLLLLTMTPEGEATYRKPPFNGSIFGKRADFEPTGKALSAMCEIANEACQSWFPSAENKK